MSTTANLEDQELEGAALSPVPTRTESAPGSRDGEEEEGCPRLLPLGPLGEGHCCCMNKKTFKGRGFAGEQVERAGSRRTRLVEKLSIPGVFVEKMSQYRVMELMNKNPLLSLTQKE